MSIINGIDAVQGDQKLSFLNPGNYRVSLVSIREGAGKMDGVPFLKTTFTVVEGQGAEATPAGTTCVHVIKKDKFGYYLKDIKALGSAILGEPASTNLMTQLMSPENPAAGVEYRVEVKRETNSKGNSYTKYAFFAVPAAPEAAVIAAESPAEAPKKGGGKRA